MTQIVVRDIKLPFMATDGDVNSVALWRLRDIIGKDSVKSTSLYKRSVDARKKDNICFVSSVLVETDQPAELFDGEKLKAANAVLLEDSRIEPQFGGALLEGRPVVVGFGPCGMFCAMLLAEYGYRPVVLERGGDVDSRAAAVDSFYRNRVLDTESNIQFGAGGAGTFSDGKLITRINDEKCRYVLEKFAQLGAPSEILTEAKPHIGTDKLREVVKNADAYIRSMGGDIMYNTAMRRVNYKSGRAASVVTDSGEIECGALIIAIGHSARDTCGLLMREGFDITPKPFSIGVRIEHLQSDIDEAMYGKYAGNPKLGHAEYALSKRVGEIGVYTFCMCPGGEVVAAASEEGGVVTNGMSRFARDGINANSAIAVSVSPSNPIEFQRGIERLAYASAGSDYSAPVQTVGDFMKGTVKHMPKRILPTYMNNTCKPSDINKILPADICKMLKLGITDFGRRLNGFDAPDAVLTGVETRTSSPLRIVRTASYTTGKSDNVYPCGEGAGYAGGITSAAVDGLQCALEIMKRWRSDKI